jgi:MFS transporter, SP family, galactose:H+ symporter
MKFAGAGSSSSAILAAVGVGIINVAATVLSLRLLNTHGRRTLLIVGVSGMIVTLITLGFAFTLPKSSDALGPLAVISLMGYVASFAISLGPIFWLLNAEIYPLKVRTKAAGIGTMANWTFNFIVSLTFLNLIEALGRSGAFWLYAGIGVVTLIFVILVVPETKGRTLEEIEQIFRRRAEHGSVGPTTPTPPAPGPPPAPAS